MPPRVFLHPHEEGLHDLLATMKVHPLLKIRHRSVHDTGGGGRVLEDAGVVFELPSTHYLLDLVRRKTTRTCAQSLSSPAAASTSVVLLMRV